MHHRKILVSRLISWLCVGFLGVGLPSLLGQQVSSTQAVYDAASKAIVLIKTDLGSGTGFFVGSEGVIVTAFHVVDGAEQVAIETMQGEIFDSVSLLVKDKRRDIAILRIAGFRLPIISFGDSNGVTAGQHVIVIGNPLGLEELRATVTDGIVSGIRDLGAGHNVIQVSAAISPGNSGGPVLNEKGEAIGVAAFKIVSGDSLNFAIPINYVHGLLDSMSRADSLQKWEGASGSKGPFAGKQAGKLTGYWKSSSGAFFYIKDHGDQVKILNETYPGFTYDFKWSNDLVQGFIYAADRAEFCVLKMNDEDHLILACPKYKKEFDAARINAEIGKSLRKPIHVWIRMR